MGESNFDIDLSGKSYVLNVKQLACALQISKSNAYELVKRNDFPKMKIGKRILIPVDALKKWLIDNLNCSV